MNPSESSSSDNKYDCSSFRGVFDQTFEVGSGQQASGALSLAVWNLRSDQISGRTLLQWHNHMSCEYLVDSIRVIGSLSLLETIVNIQMAHPVTGRLL